MIEVKDITFQYDKGSVIFDHASAEFKKGQLYAVWGESGSGKTTLLSLLGGLETLRSGDIVIEEKSIRGIKDWALRSQYISYIFQDYLLLKHLNAVENVITAMEISKTKVQGKEEAAKKFLEVVGISPNDMYRRVTKLSGGQQQRVAIARALAAENDYILADEPTGNLDKNNAAAILEILLRLAHEKHKCIIVATHSEIIKKAADIVYAIEDQKLVEAEKAAVL